MRIYLCLGRCGDLINLLPVIEDEAKKSGKPTRLAVSRDFASVLDGVSYVDPIVLDLTYDRPGAAERIVRQRFPGDAVVMAQAWGNDIRVVCNENDFCREMWAKSFTSLHWGAVDPVFDRRDFGREEDLINKYAKTDKPIVCVNTAGHSGKWNNSDGFVDRVRAAMPDHHIVDLSTVNAHRIYDLLGVFSLSKCLITIDTATLHLAAATSGLPVITLIPNRDDDWCVAPWRRNHIRRIRYAEIENRFNEIVSLAKNPIKPTVFHSWCDWRKGFDARIAFARSTWHPELSNANYVDMEFKKCAAFRDSQSMLGDTRDMPFVRDMVDFACAGLSADNSTDIIVLTNSDIGLAHGAIGRVIEAVHRDGATYCHRWDQLHPFNRVPNRAMWKNLTFYDGSDLFAFTPKWWASNRTEFFDMLLGVEAWDGCMRHLIIMRGGSEVRKAIFHQKHRSFWEQPENFRKNVGNVYNCKLYSEFLKKHRLPWNNIKLQK